jgi:hypothetical protein
LKKQQLEFDADVDFLLIGLVTNQTISRLGWLINQNSGLDFSRIEDLELPDFNPAANSGFSKLDYFDEENHLHFSLIANKEFGEILSTELKQFDFLMVLRGGIEFFEENNFLSMLRKISDIRLAASINQPKIKNNLSWIV